MHVYKVTVGFLALLLGWRVSAVQRDPIMPKPKNAKRQRQLGELSANNGKWRTKKAEWMRNKDQFAELTLTLKNRQNSVV